jgi:hypothetical protein
MHHRTWFPYILIGMTLLLGLGILVWVAPKLMEPSPYASEAADPITTEEYREAVLLLFADYAGTGDYARMYQGLLELTVPTGYQPLHLELALTFDKLRSGDIDEGQARLEALRSAYPWLVE